MMLAEGEDEDRPDSHAAHIFKASQHAASLTKQLLALDQSQTAQPVVLEAKEFMSRVKETLSGLIDKSVSLQFA